MDSRTVLLVGGARPNFPKLAPLWRALQSTAGLRPLLVHTGQHYDARMSGSFFADLGLPEPEHFLGVGSGSHAEQTARVMERFEPLLAQIRPAVVVVVGDVNSTLACALVTAKAGDAAWKPRLAHVEAGLRSFDRTMPEEVNRVATDALADLLFVTEPSGRANLLREGMPADRIHLVGNTMIDSLAAHLDAALERQPWRRFGLLPGEYGVVTLHRPSNVDDPAALASMGETLRLAAGRLPLIFPVHPRTARRLADAGVVATDGLVLVEPLAYLDFLGLLARARVALTDSGGIQEETTWLGVPCLTVRHNTERPITIEAGTNRLVGTDRSAILAALDETLSRPLQGRRAPALWDGRAAERIVAVLDASLEEPGC